MNEAPLQHGSLFGAPLRFVETIGARIFGTIRHIGHLSYLLLDSLRWLLRGVFNKRVRPGGAAMIAQVVRVGVASIFIVSLVSSAIGFILALQMAPPLDQLGQVTLVPNIIAVATLRELGPLVAAIVLTGFAGAAIAAEIGTMVVNEEVEALEAIALNPVRFLVVPRLTATMSSLICLAVLSNAVAILAAAVASRLILGVPWLTYYNNTVAQVEPVDFLTGLVKAAVFGLLIGLIACGNGLKVTGGAEGVGNATTRTVVQSVVAIVLADLIFTVVFYALGWF
ncbi:MAG: ABC transporter permease [Phycisphaerales bacterium]|nr:ABC transporter permease [Phycisphaerales bacterium]